MKANKQQKQIKIHDDKIALFEKDIWKNEELGFKPNTVHGMYQLNFTRLKPVWFKLAVQHVLVILEDSLPLANFYQINIRIFLRKILIVMSS